MKQHLQLVLFLQVTAISQQQSCYTQCLQITCGNVTSINVMLVDGGTDYAWQGAQQWYDRKTAEFNALFRAVSVELSHAQNEEMLTQARPAYLLPSL